MAHSRNLKFRTLTKCNTREFNTNKVADNNFVHLYETRNFAKTLHLSEINGIYVHIHNIND